MATNPISSVTTNAQQVQRPRQNQQPQQDELLIAADKDSRARQEQAQQARQTQPREQLRPVINEKGQSIGNVINTSA